MGRRDTAVVLALAALAAAACGGGDKRPALWATEFRAKANAECRRLAPAADELRQAAEPSVTGRQVKHRLDRAAGILRGRLRGIDDLVAPDELTDTVTRLVSTLERYAAQLEALGARAQPGQTFAQLQSNNPGRVQRLNALTDRANALAASIDLVECISGTP